VSAGLPPEAELALLLCGTRARRERAAARIVERAGVADDAALAAVLREQRVLLLAVSRLERAAPSAVGESLRSAVSATHAAARSRAMLFAAAAEHLLDALERAAIPAVALKGPTLATELHGDPALREYADIDVLVAPDRLDAAAAVASRLGWTDRAWSGVPLRDGLPALHRVLRHPGGALPELELHWRVHWYETRFAAEALDRAVVGADGRRRLKPVDQLAILLLFYARDGFAGLRLAADLGAWWDRHGDADVPSRLRELADRHPALAEPWRAATTAACAVAGLPLDPAAHGLVPTGRRARLAVRLTNWRLVGDADQVRANVTLVDALLAPRGQWRAILGRHAPAPSGGTADAPTPGGARRRAATHAVKTLTRCALGLWRIRMGACWDPAAADASVRGRPPIAARAEA
jgi:hypothetical protein